MITREDNLKMVYRPDGSTIAEFGDGTRITSFYVDSNGEPINNANNFSSQFKEKYIKIECPGFATSIFNSRTSECSLAFGDGTLVSCEPTRIAYTVIHKTGELIEIAGGADGHISFLPRYKGAESTNDSLF